MVNLWRAMADVVIAVVEEMKRIVVAALREIEAALRDMAEAARDATEAIENLLPVIEGLVGLSGGVKSLADSFGRLAGALRKAYDMAKKLLTVMKSLEKLGGPTYDGRGGGGGEPTKQHGAWRIGRKGSFTLHPGETVLPPSVAETFRSFITALNTAGIGARSFNLPTMGGAAAGVESAAGLNQYVFGPGAFQGAFPNVRDGRDAKGFVGRLDRLTELSSVRGKVVG
jgi:hypothetical protein